MNEGRPTKANWWSRPRPQGTGADTAPDHLTEPDSAYPAVLPDSTGGGAEPSGPPEARTTHPGRAREGDTGGDYELERPAGIPGPREAAAPVAPAPAVPDRVPAEADAGQGDRHRDGGDGHYDGDGDGDGDFELERPAPPRPKALHDPDPYGTPPYGGPGPWAPAPPVQHPTAPRSQDGPDARTPQVRDGHAYDPHAQDPRPQDPHAHEQGGHEQGGLPHGSYESGSPEAATPAHGTPLADGAPSHEGPPLGEEAPVHAPPLPQGIPDEAPVRDPWQNYDPWAAPGSLQQSGVAVPTVAQRRRRARKVLVLGAVALALVSGGVGGAAGAYLERNGGLTDIELPQAAKEAPGRAPDSVAGIAAHALPSVVTLHVKGSEEEGTGTGFVLDGEGHILTNNHVIKPWRQRHDIRDLQRR